MSQKKEIYLIADNIRSAWNVGSFFRTADAVGVLKIYLTGYTATPEHSKVLKTSLGAEEFVAWEHHKQAWRLIDRLKKEGVYIIALEQTSDAIDIKKFKPKFPMALIVGHELRGVPESLLKRSDKKIVIPMHGKKESLNVAVAFGMAIYAILEK